MKRIKSKSDQQIAWRLFAAKPWLIKREQQFIDLIDFVGSEENKNLIFQLLERFTCIDDDQYAFYLDQIAKAIINDSGFGELETVVCAMSAGNEADSGQAVVQLLKVYLKRNGWNSFATCNTINGLPKRCKENRTKIVLVDEFIGTGHTLHRRINDVKGMLKEYSPDIYVCFVAGMEEGLQKIESEGTRIFCTLPLKKGISDFYASTELQLAIERMSNIEKKLSPSSGKLKFDDYSFGYGKSESLFARSAEGANIPNNTFPIFWWNFDAAMKPTNPLFVRYDDE